MPVSLTITRCHSSETWDAFNAESPQGNIFCQTAFLNAQNIEYDLWFVEKNGEPQAGIIIRKHYENSQEKAQPFMYQGILFSQKVYSLPIHSKSKLLLEIFEFMLTELSNLYNSLSFCLHYTLIDLRGIQWFHYHEPHLGKFTIDLRYSGLIDIGTISDFETYLTTIRKVRRYEYRTALREGLTIEVSKDIDLLDHLHHLTFNRQCLERTDRGKSFLHNVAEAALTYGIGELLICYTKDRAPASATLFLYDDSCGYYLFGANDPAYRNTGSGTLLLLENIRRCFARGLKYVDVCGINSPHRGDFKSSFNAVPVPYYVVTWEQPFNTDG